LQTGGAWSGVRAEEMLRHLAALHAHPLPVEVLIERLGLESCGRTPYRRLSGGQQQRLSLAMALVGRPELLFVDEPTAGMDPQGRRDTWALLEELRDDGVTTVLTTHYLEEAEALADRVGVIAAGRLIAVDTPRMLGRRDAALARVSWRTEDGTWEHTESATPTAVVADLAARFDGEVPGLTVTRPTLEDIYLEMIKA
jgi:ABC-2 type transport system ATP-binding protein